jgi:predicted DNA-binding transcriptional regulator AlpA
MKNITEANLPTVGYVRLPVILAVFPVSAATWWNMVKDGRAPKSVKLGPRITAWKASEIRAMLEAQ